MLPLGENMVHCHLCLCRCSVCQHLSAIHIANGIYTLHIGLHVIVGGNALVAVSYAGVLQVQGCRVGGSSYSHKHLVGSQ